jgi:hypothetical protein
MKDRGGLTYGKMNKILAFCGYKMTIKKKKKYSIEPVFRTGTESNPI